MGTNIPTVSLGTHVIARVAERDDEGKIINVVTTFTGYVISGVFSRRDWDILISDPDSKWRGMMVTLDFGEFREIKELIVDGIPCCCNMNKEGVEIFRKHLNSPETKRITKEEIIMESSQPGFQVRETTSASCAN